MIFRLKDKLSASNGIRTARAESRLFWSESSTHKPPQPIFDIYIITTRKCLVKSTF